MKVENKCKGNKRKDNTRNEENMYKIGRFYFLILSTFCEDCELTIFAKSDRGSARSTFGSPLSTT